MKKKFSGRVETVKKKEAFLRNFPKYGRLGKTADAMGVKPHTVHGWLRQDNGFKEAYEDLRPVVAEMLLDEAVKRAKDGWKEPVYQGGKLVGTVRKKSDRLMSQLLKGFNQEMFGDRVEVNANLKGRTLEDLSTEELLAQIAAEEKK
jgi:hypothetical protein